MFFLLVSVVLLLFPQGTARAAAVINEVLTAADTGGEWIELYNTGDAPENMVGWQLNPDGIGYFLFPAGFSLASKSFVVVHLRAAGVDTAKDLYHSASALKSNMGNTSGFAALFSGEPGKDTIKSYVEWGAAKQTWESAAADAGLWDKGSYAATTSASEGFSIGLSADGVSGGSASAWSVFHSPTPGSANGAHGSFQASTSAPAVSSSSPYAAAAYFPSGAAAILPAFRAYAGQDRIVGAGSQTDFMGSAAGIKGEPLDGARFLWNFGDGEVREGRNISHIFQIPGTYTVGLHVSSGIDAASDYARVSVVPNKLTFDAVVGGADGFVRIKNNASGEVDVGEWILEDGPGKKFALPTRTKIAPLSEAAFANAVTGILKTGESGAVTLYYPNGIPALRWTVPQSVPEAVSAQTAQTPHEPVSGHTIARVAAPASADAASAPARADALSAMVSSSTVTPSSGAGSPAPARKQNRGLRFFWITALASGFTAAGFFLVKIFL